MEASSTYLKTSFLRFIICCLAAIVVLFSPFGEVMGQTKVYSDLSPSSGIRAWGAISGIESTDNSVLHGVFGDDHIAISETSGTLGTNFEASLFAKTKTLLGLGYNGEAWVQYKFADDLPSGTKVLIPFDLPESSGLNLDLLNLVGGLLGLVEDNIVNASVYSGASEGSNGTEITSGIYKDIVRDAEGNLCFLITSTGSTFNSVRFSLRYQTTLLGVNLGSSLTSKTYDAYYLEGVDACTSVLFTDLGRSQNINVNLSETVINPEFVLDENTSNYSEIRLGLLSAGATASQSLYFPELSEPNSILNVRLQVNPAALNVNLLGAYGVRAYNGDTQVFEQVIDGGLIGGVDVLSLLGSGGIVTIPFEIANQYDRVEVVLYSTVNLNVGSGVRLYGASRTSAGCPPPPPTPSPLIDPVCANATIVAMQNVDDPQNAVDGDFDSYATIRSDAGVLIGLGGNEGHLEVAFDNPVPVGKTAYVRIDYDDNILKALLAGSLGNVVAYLLDNLVLGNHYFDVVLTNSGAPVLTTSGNDFFASANGQVRIVQDRLGRYYIAIKAENEFTNIRLVDHTVGALGVLTPDKYLNVYSICYENSDAICDPAFATYVGGEGIDLAVTPLGDVGVTDAPFAIDGNLATASTISIGNVGVGASVYQYVNYHSLSAEADHFRVKLKMPGGAVTAEVLGSIVIKAFDGNDEVYSQQLTSGLLSGVDLLEQIANQEMLNIPIAPGKPFDRVAVGIESLVSANVIDNPLEIYNIERFSADCPDPELTVPDPTETPFEQSSCEAEVVAWDHANFPFWAADGNNETFATLSANSGALAGIGAYTGYLEYEFASEIPANKTTYIRIDMEEDLLGRLLSGTLGTLVDNVGGLLLGDHYFSVEAKPSINGAPVLTGSSQSGFAGVTGGDLRLVQDNIGRYYIAVTPDAPYKNIRITEHFPALVGTTQEGSTMNIYEACQEIGTDACLPARFTSFDQTGLSLGALNGAGVTNADHAINSNSSDYSEISTGTVAIAAQVSQRIYFNQLSQTGDDLRIRLQMSAPTLLTADVLGNYEVVTYHGAEEQERFTLRDGGIINDLNILNILFNSGGIQTLTFETTKPYDRVDVVVGSLLNATTNSPVRLYEVKRIGAGCPPDPATESPFENPTCIAELIDASNADDIQNLFDDDFDTYAVLNSGAGTLLGINEYEGFVELGFGQDIEAGKTAYVRIDFDPTLLENLLGGSIGGALASVVDNLTLGDHYFSIQAKNANSVVLEGASNDNFGGNTDRIRIVQDKFGRYYIAITPDEAFDAIRITDHTNSALGVLAQPNTMNVYGACVDNPTADCQPVFVTSFDATGLDLDLADLGGSGVTDASDAIDDNTTDYSEINLGAVAVGKSVEQYFDFRKPALPTEVVNITLSYGTGAVDLNLLGSIEIKAYNETVEVAQLDWNGGIINGVNVLNALNNGGKAVIPFGPGVEYDRISVGITGVAGLSVLPALRIYAVEKDCNVPQFVAWKSYVVDGDASLASVKGGETVEYTIHVRNTGTVALEDLILTDVLPAHTALVAGSISDGGTEAAGTLTWENVDVPVAGEALVSFSVTVDQNLTGVSEITNVALVKLDVSDRGVETFPPLDNQNPIDPDESGDTGTIIPVEQIYSLVSWKAYAITGGTSATSVSGGETVEYTIYVRNTGNQDLTNVVVSDVLPAGVTYVSGGTLTGSTVSFNIGSLAVGATSTGRSFTVRVDDDLTGVDIVRNVAVVNGDDLTPTESYPPVDNETPGEPDDTGDTGTEIPVVPLHDIDISLNGLTSGGNTGPAVSGETITYTITVENTGNKDLTGVELSALVPTNTTFGSSADGGTDSGTGTVNFPTFDLGVGETLTFTYDVDVDPIDPSVVTSIDNTGTVTFRNEGNTADETRTANHTMNTSCITLDASGISLPGNDEICEGGSITLNASLTGGPIAGAQFLWFNNPSLTGTPLVGDAVTVSPDATTTYYVIVNAEGYCFDTPPAQVTITVNPQPSIPTIGYTGGLEICAGESLVLTATATGATRYVWYKDGVLQTETSATFAATESGVYTVAAENAAGCPSAVSAPVIVVVTPRASSADLNVDGNGGPVCEGSSVSLTASSATIANPVFNWYSDAALTELIFTGTSLTINPAENITLYVTVQGDGVCETAPVDAEAVAVVVNSTPDFLVDGPLNFSIEVGNSVTLPTITALTATVTWYDNDGNVYADPVATETFDTPGTYTYTAVITEADHCTVTVSVVINVYAAGECPPVYNRVYATDGSEYGVSSLLFVDLGTVNNPTNAADGDIDTYSELTEGANALGLLGQTYQILKWNTTVDAGTPVSTKLGKQFSTANVLGSLRIVAVDASGNAVSTVHNVESNILDAAGGLNVYDYTFTPADGSGQAVPYVGVKVYYQGAISLLQTARIYEAYYHEVGAVDCGDDEVLDVLHGVENPIDGLGVANALIGVTDPENVVDGDPGTVAVMNNVAGVNAQTLLEVRYSTPGLAGDEVHIQFTDPSSLLLVGALESFTIQPYLGDAPVGDPIVEDGTTLRIELLTDGSAGEAIYTADRPFDRIKMLYGGVASVLDQLYVNEITRVVPQLEIGDNGDNTFEICEGGDIVIPEPDNCTSYLIYDLAAGGTVVDISTLPAGVHTLYIQTVRFGTCEVGERTEIEVTINALPVAPVVSDREVCQTPLAGDELYEVTALVSHTLNYYETETATTPLSDVPVVNSAVPGVYTVYVSQVSTVTGCEGPRATVTIEVMETVRPALTELEQTFCEIDKATVSDLNTDGATGTLNWYLTAADGTALTGTELLVSGAYYAAQVVDGCESVSRTEVMVSITETLAPTIDNATPEFCATDNRTLADLQVVGTDIKWYASATSTDVLPATTVLEDGVTYYATQMGDNCESAERLAVTPVVSDCTALLSITKTADEDRVTAGESTSFTLTITNEGPGAILSGDVIKLGERPSEGVTITGYEVASGNGTIDGSGNSATVTANAPIPVGGIITVKVTATVDADAPATITNGIDVWGPDKDPETDPKDDEDDTPPIPVDRESALSITKVADEARVKAGESTSFTLTITNNGPSVIEVGKEINLTERPGEGVTITGYEVTAGNATVAGNGNTAVLTTTGKIAVGGTITVKVTADVAANAGETITNGITVWGPDKDPETDPEDDEDDTPPIPVDHDAVLSITKVADQDRVTAGESTSFTLTITNEGPAVVASGKEISLTERPGEGVIITGYEVTSGNGTAAGTGNSATVTTSEAIAVGGTIIVKVTATIDADAPATITNGIDVWGPDKNPETDPKDDEDDTPPIPVDRESVLGITKVADEARVKAGEPTSFTLTITNNGPSFIEVGKEIDLTERPGEGVTITGYEVTAGTATVAGNGNTAVLTTTGKIAVGGAITVKVTADVAANAGETITNGITVWGPDKDPETDPEDDEDDTPPIPVDHDAVLSITKVADQARVKAGEPTSFTLTITNEGPAVIASGKVISLTERPGQGVTITGYEVTSDNGTASGTGNSATVTTSKAIAVGGTITVKVTADVAANAGETITNGIGVWGPDKNPGTDDPDDEDDTPPIPVDHESVLSITKTANDQRVISGGTTSFEVTVTNNGPAVMAVGETIAVEERPSAGLAITGYEVTSNNATIGGNGNNRQLTTTAAIAVGGTITFTVTADVTALGGSNVSNGIAVWGPDKNPTTDEEDDEDETPEIPVERPYTLSVEKVADQSLVTAGKPTTFTVTVTNNGPMAIESGKEIALQERPGAGVTITGYQVVSGAASVIGTGNQATITTSDAIEVGATIVIKITADVAATATGTITNGITVWAPDRDPDTDDPDDEDDTDPIPVDATLVIPNLFTPNGDGLNDLFVIKNLLQYQGRELVIINRWGNQVYKSNSYNNEWDGGSLAEGTYYYILRVRNGNNGEWRTYKGAVAIIRVTGR